MSSRVDAFLSNLEKLASEDPAQAELEKKAAEEAYFDKLANQDETIEAATQLNLCSGYIDKVAEADGLDPEMHGLLKEASEILSQSSADFMMGLQKIAAEDMSGMVTDMIDTQMNLYKVAQVLNTCAEGCPDENFVKVAETVTTINNKLYDEIAELAQNDKTVDNYLKHYFSQAE